MKKIIIVAICMLSKMAYAQDPAVQIAKFTAEINNSPKDDKPLTSRAYVYYNINRPDSATIDIDKALKINPKNYEASYLKAALLFTKKEYYRAMLVLTDAINNNPKKELKYFKARAQANDMDQRLKPAIDDYKMVLHIDPADELAKTRLQVLTEVAGSNEKTLAQGKVFDYKKAEYTQNKEDLKKLTEAFNELVKQNGKLTIADPSMKEQKKAIKNVYLNLVSILEGKIAQFPTGEIYAPLQKLKQDHIDRRKYYIDEWKKFSGEDLL